MTNIEPQSVERWRTDVDATTIAAKAICRSYADEIGEPCQCAADPKMCVASVVYGRTGARVVVALRRYELLTATKPADERPPLPLFPAWDWYWQELRADLRWARVIWRMWKRKIRTLAEGIR